MNKTEARNAIDELTIILMYLTRFTENEKFKDAKNFYAWKGYDFDVINELENKDYIRQGSYKSKSVYITEDGLNYARELMKKYNIEDWK